MLEIRSPMTIETSVDDIQPGPVALAQDSTDIPERHRKSLVFPENPQILRNNTQIPSKEEDLAIRETLSDALDELASLQASIDDIERLSSGPLLERLVDRESQLVRFIDDLKAALSPIRRIPPEIVFEFLGDRASHCTDLNRGPWIFGWICSSWRSMIVSSASLWSHITLNVSRASVSVKRTGTILEECLIRSQNAPLEVHLVHGSSDLDSESAIALLDILSNHSLRWKRIFFETVDRKMLQFLSQRVKGRLPILQSMTLGLGASNHPAPENKILAVVDAFAVTPSLTSVTLSAFPSHLPVDLPWSQINDYRQNSPERRHDGPLHLNSILEKMPRLKNIEFMSYQKQLPAPVNDEGALTVIHTPDLQSISISGVNPLPCSLHCPQLNSLNVRVPGRMMRGFQDIAAHFPRIIQQSQCSLTMLQVTGNSASSNFLREILRLTPNLDFLNVNESASGTFNPEMLSWMKDDSLVPSLCHLAMYCRPFALKDAQSLMNMVHSRRKVLKELVLVVQVGREKRLVEEALNGLVDLRREGIVVIYLVV